MHSFLSHSTGNQPSVLTPHLVNLLAKPIGSICRRRLHQAHNPCKGKTRPAGPAVIGARLPLDRWRSRGLLTKPIPHRGPLARDGPPGLGFAATGLAAASHRQVAISMAEAGARRQRPAPSESFSVSLGMKRLCRLYDALRCNRSRRANRGGRTLGSEIYGGSLVGFLSSTHRSHQKPLHVLIGSPSTIYEGSAVARTGSGGATKMQNAGLACPHGRRRQQFSPASV